VAAASIPRRMNVGRAYRVGGWLRWKSLGSVAAGSPLRMVKRAVWCIAPIDYVRYREFQFAFAAIEEYRPHALRVLDIGSPELLPVTVAACRPDATVRVVNILAQEAEELLRDAHALPLRNLFVEVQDARSLTYQANSFDLVTSISVFEHIAPERDGEVPAVHE